MPCGQLADRSPASISRPTITPPKPKSLPPGLPDLRLGLDRRCAVSITTRTSICGRWPREFWVGQDHCPMAISIRKINRPREKRERPSRSRSQKAALQVIGTGREKADFWVSGTRFRTYWKTGTKLRGRGPNPIPTRNVSGTASRLCRSGPRPRRRAASPAA
jgi:hypothetical protein